MTKRPLVLAAATLLAVPLLGALVAPWVAPHDPFRIVGPALSSPSGAHWLGTDALGRDILSRLMWGGRVSWAVGVLVGVVAGALGLLVGLWAALSAGWMDALLMRGTDAVLTLPRFFLAIVVIALFGPGVDRIVWVLALTSWAGLARVVRSEAISLREREFVTAARLLGANRWQIAVGELLPNVAPTLLVLTGLLVGRTVLMEAGLSFVGLGDPMHVSWGTMAGEAHGTLRIAWWGAAAPGMIILATVLGINLLVDALGGRRSL